jgi:hypothetical protein
MHPSPELFCSTGMIPANRMPLCNLHVGITTSGLYCDPWMWYFHGMIWLSALGLISIIFIFSGIVLTAKRFRTYRTEMEARRARAFSEMMEAAGDRSNPNRHGENRGKS